MSIPKICTVFAALAFPAVPVHAQLEAAPGFESDTVHSLPGSSIPGGLCVLPDDRIAFFDGASVIAIDPDTLHWSRLHTPRSFVYGSFLVVEPPGGSLLFGESSAGTITRIPLAGGAASTVAVVPFAYDAAFSPSGELFVTRGNSAWNATEIVRVDLGSGALDVIAAAPGPSGPLCFDAAGNLHYGENSPFFPALPGSGTIWVWPADTVELAIGPSSWTTAEAVAFATRLDAISDLAFDAEGDLVISDSASGKVYVLSPFGWFRHPIASTPAGGITYLAFLDDSSAGAARFDPFQPSWGGELLVVDSDYATYSSLTRIRPRRPTLTTTPSSPIPAGDFVLAMEDGAPYAWLHLFAAPASMPEIPVFLLGTPLFFGLAPGAIVALPPIRLDANGTISLPVANPGLEIAVFLQGALLDLSIGALGTTPPTSVSLQ